MLTLVIIPSIVPCAFDQSRGFRKCPFHLLHQNTIFSIKFQKPRLFTNSVQVPYANKVFNYHRKQYYSAMSTSLLQNGSKISRLSRQEAQKALFEYLHGTRSFNYTDAEHMSKNSPMFLNGILSKFENEDDVGKSLARFLRYHPINEFEPFFESLGMEPSDLDSILPKNLIYLSDDDILLENYNVLCNYGVPRSKIGKMYKEGMEMFRYDLGVLSTRLQYYEKLGLSKPTIIKLVTCCPRLLVGDVDVNFLNVLEKLKSFGVELDWIKGSLSDKNKYDWSWILEMLHFLDGMGCNKNKLSMFIKSHPKFILNDSGKNIYILVDILLKLGLKRDELPLFFEQYPRSLTGKFTMNLWKSIQFLSEIGMENMQISIIVSKHAQVLGSSCCRQPTYVLKILNLSAKKLVELIEKDPSQFSALTSRKKISTCLPKTEGTFLKEKTDFLLRIGFVENSDEMTKALSKFRGRGDQLQERFDILVNTGLDSHTVSEMIKSVPSILNQTSEVIQKKINYLLNHLGYPLEAVVAFPTCLCYNLEKIKLRYFMYKWLRENGVVIATKNRKMLSSNAALSTLLACSDERFVKYVVSLHPEGADVWENLKNLIPLT